MHAGENSEPWVAGRSRRRCCFSKRQSGPDNKGCISGGKYRHQPATKSELPSPGNVNLECLRSNPDHIRLTGIRLHGITHRTWQAKTHVIPPRVGEYPVGAISRIEPRLPHGRPPPAPVAADLPPWQVPSHPGHRSLRRPQCRLYASFALSVLTMRRGLRSLRISRRHQKVIRISL